MNESAPLLLTDAAAASWLGISRATFWRRVNDGTFPKPVRIHGVTRWVRKDLEAAVVRHQA
ncbi:helix-turn-helix transcriptional regulator [Acuticoccus yangtzensis]|uniref:helix-turn-helix transcriptional regulator n=1 Tax=Acuticoccus yangtzensis TaxID=1443441 RepID=UPI0009496CF6|nr:AlpA family phage regulatory protein [Acuticoccus yangtzensis]